MSWTNPLWVSINWVSASWRGQANVAPPGKWNASGWNSSGWISPLWASIETGEISRISSEDSLGISLVDSTQYRRIRSTDTLTLQVSATFSTAYKRHILAQDSVNLSLGEVKNLRALVASSDSLNLSAADLAANTSGTLFQITTSDTLNITADDPGVHQFIEALDSLNIGVEATSDPRTRISVSDSLTLTLQDAQELKLTGSFSRFAGDSLNLSLSESLRPHRFEVKSSSDSLFLSLEELADRQQGIITVYLRQSDDLDIGFDDARIRSESLEVFGVSSSDSLNLSVGEAATSVSLIFLSVGDTLGIAIVDSLRIDKSSVDLTWEDANFPWGGTSLRELKPLPVFASGFDFFQADTADTFKDNTPIRVLLERIGLTIYGRDRQGNWREDPDLTKLVKAVYPVFRGEPGTEVDVYVGAQDSMEGSITWDGPHTFVIGEDTYVTPLISGRFIAVRFESVGQRPWSLLSYDLDITKVGRGR